MITEQQIHAYKINENGYKPLSSDKHKDSPMAFQMAASDYLWDVVLPHCQLLQQHQADHGNLHPTVVLNVRVNKEWIKGITHELNLDNNLAFWNLANTLVAIFRQSVGTVIIQQGHFLCCFI